MKKLATRNTTLALAVGTAFSLGLSAAQASGNPFAMQTLSQGYMVAEASGNAAEKPADKAAEAKCGAGMAAKTKDGNCAAAKDAATNDKPAKPKKAKSKKQTAPAKAVEGKCGEGKCGAGMGMPEPKKD